MDFRKRERPNFKLNGTAKKLKSESELSSGIRGKTKPCMKYFSMDGCPYGENCHFLHYFPGGYNAVAHLMNLPPIPTAPTAIQNGAPSTATTKSKLCKNYSTAEGCKFGDQCHFAHGEHQLGKPISEDPRTVPPLSSRHVPSGPAASFGASATAKISVDASLSGAIIGHGGVNSKQICRQTGAKLSIRDHESDTNLKNIELEGTFDQIKEASAMVRELISSVSVRPGAMGGGALSRPPPAMHLGGPLHTTPTSSSKKTKLCDNFSKGSCTFGERCHFAHGATELRKTRV
ncbi:hypothetical protein QVD17_15811 [Tagetes erecta]|uniref:C3H1-type domain-containing protein n=1 Tax=Tagetes erecta TaxID=13708 RepID=A0AAD8NYZ1_TARER|nr:hypothetical protein QVD17_15811 [Tagetes erecta]